MILTIYSKYDVLWMTTQKVHLEKQVTQFERLSEETTEMKAEMITLRLHQVEATATSVLLGWDQPKISTNYDHFDVKYKQKGVSLWQSLTSKEPTLLLTDLKTNATYLFRVRIVFEAGAEGPFSVVSDEIMTLQSLAGILKQSATKVDSRMPEIYTKRISRGVPEIYESRYEKTGFLHMRKQRRRSASR